MRICKKVTMVILALLPVCAFLAYVVSNVGGDSLSDYVPLGSVQIVNLDGLKIVTEANSWSSRLLDPVFADKPLTGVFEAVGRMLLYFQDNIGLPISLPVVGSVVLLLYLAWIELVNAFVELITFVPRKCAEIFK